MKSVSLAALILSTSGASFAQTPLAISYVEGKVYVDAQRLEPSVPGVPMKEGSVVRAEKGRVQILFGRGDKLFLGENSSVRVATSAPLEILSGSAVVITGEIGPQVTCHGALHLSDAGVFRFDVHSVVSENFCKVRVFKGAASAPMPSFVWILTPGRMVDLGNCGDHTPRDEFNIEEIDNLDRWSRERDTQVRR
jgi:hypothetical protein